MTNPAAHPLHVELRAADERVAIGRHEARRSVVPVDRPHPRLEVRLVVQAVVVTDALGVPGAAVALGKRGDNTQEVWDIVTRAREIRSERAQIQRTYDRYLELAKGDAEIAFGFLTTNMGVAGYEHDHSAFVQTLDPRPQAA